MRTMIIKSLLAAAALLGSAHFAGAQVYSTSLGAGNTNLGNFSLASGGYNAIYGGYGNHALGWSGTIGTGSFNFVTGLQNATAGNFNFVAGASNQPAGAYNVFAGQNNRGTGNQNLVFGSFLDGAALGGSVILSDSNPFSIRTAGVRFTNATADSFTGIFNGGYSLRTNSGQVGGMGIGPNAGLFIKPSTPNSAVDGFHAVVGINKPAPAQALDVVGSGAFTGNVNAVNGNFSNVNAVNGTFTGPLSGTNGTFTGNVNAVNGTFSGPVSGTTATFTGPVGGGTTGTFTGGVMLGGPLNGIHFYIVGNQIEQLNGAATAPMHLNANGGNVILTNSFGVGNVGIGTVSPNARLEVHGDITHGPTGEFFATASPEKLKIIRGGINGGLFPSVQKGTGFSVGRGSVAGVYTVTFTTPFSSPPSVTCTLQVGYGTIIHNIAPTANFFQVTIVNFTGTPTDISFDFIAVGPRP